MTASTPCILGVWTTLDVGLAEPFLRSARRSAPRARLVIFAGRLDTVSLRRLDALVDDLVVVDDRFPLAEAASPRRLLDRARRTRGLRRFYEPGFRTLSHVLDARPGTSKAHALEYEFQGLQSLRYRLYHEWVTANSAIDAVLISDVRDVLFQSDPFVEPVDGLEVFLEPEATRLSVDGFNSRWLRQLYGDRGLAVVAGELASCSGVTIGEREPMLRYLQAMADELDRHWGPLGPRDQGVHNWLLRTGQLARAAVRSNVDGRVLTMGGAEPLPLSPTGRVQLADGREPAVVHQYDRHPQLAQRLAAAILDGEPAATTADRSQELTQPPTSPWSSMEA